MQNNEKSNSISNASPCPRFIFVIVLTLRNKEKWLWSITKIYHYFLTDVALDVASSLLKLPIQMEAAATSFKSPTKYWDSHVTFISLVITVHRCTLVPASVSFLYLGDMKRVVTRDWLTLVKRNAGSIFRPRDGWNWITFSYTRQLNGLATSRI